MKADIGKPGGNYHPSWQRGAGSWAFKKALANDRRNKGGATNALRHATLAAGAPYTLLLATPFPEQLRARELACVKRGSKEIV